MFSESADIDKQYTEESKINPNKIQDSNIAQ